MIAKSIWISLYAILIFGFLYMGTHLAINLKTKPHPVYEELRGEHENPTPRAVYMAKYKKFQERNQSTRSESAGNNEYILSSNKTALLDPKQNKKLVIKQ